MSSTPLEHEEWEHYYHQTMLSFMYSLILYTRVGPPFGRDVKFNKFWNGYSLCYIKVYILVRFLQVLVNFIENLITMLPLIRDLYNYKIRVLCAWNVKTEKRVQSIKIIVMVVLGTMFVDETSKSYGCRLLSLQVIRDFK